MELPFAESYRIKTVEKIRSSSRQEREQWLKEAKYNLFNLKSSQVFIDLLTDSGTGAMSDHQWSAIMLGDESYAGARSFYNMKAAIKEILGFQFVLPTHQGRGAENVLFSTLVKPGDVVPGNCHFDTTKGHIEFRSASAIDCTINEASNPSLIHPFKGNVDLVKLEGVFSKYPRKKIPMIIVTVTCNTVGGQPVSLGNLKAVKTLAEKYKVPLCLDCARFAENAYFIKMREKGYKDKSIREIVLEMFSYADFATMSCKKDCMMNIGGFLAMKDENLWRKAFRYNVLFEGFSTYGGMAGRDVNAIAQSLYEATDINYLETRINQVKYLADRLEEFGIPFQKPVGGHAIFLDAGAILSDVPRKEFPDAVLGCELYLEAGIRGTGIGAIFADRDPVTRENRFPAVEFYRLAIPRRCYTNNHMDVVAVAVKNVFDRRHGITRGFRISKEDDILRHFTIELERFVGKKISIDE